MNELLFALFLLAGFLLGTLLFGHLFYFTAISLPNLVKNSGSSPFGTILIEMIRKIFPLLIWLVVSVSLVLVINNYFPFYIKLFYCGLAIAFIFSVSGFKRVSSS